MFVEYRIELCREPDEERDMVFFTWVFFRVNLSLADPRRQCASHTIFVPHRCLHTNINKWL